MLNIKIIGGPLSQWDLNRQVELASDAQIDEVHFAKSGDKSALVVIPVDGVANIPNIHLQNARNLIVYAVGNDRTIGFAVFGVSARAKPEDYIYTETETLTFRALEEQIADRIKSPVSAELGQTIVVKAIDGNGKPTEWEAVNIQEQVQADWSQNDNAQKDYVKNRPFYLKNPAEITIFEHIISAQTLMYMAEGSSLDIEIGKEYTVTIFNRQFKATAYSDPNGFVCLGNGEAALSGNPGFSGDVPFGYAGVKGFGCVFVLSEPYLSDSGLVSSETDEIPVKITTVEQVAVPINKKFLPLATRTSEGVISKQEIRNEVISLSPLGIFKDSTTFRMLKEHLMKSSLSLIWFNYPGLNKSLSFLVFEHEISIGTNCVISVKGSSVSRVNFSEVVFVFPLNPDGSVNEDALPEKIAIEIPSVILLKSANKKNYEIKVDDNGLLTATEFTE